MAVSSTFAEMNVLSLAVFDSNLVAGTDDGVYRLAQDNKRWVAVNSGLTTSYVCSFAVSGTNLFAGTARGGVFILGKKESHWTLVNTGLPDCKIFALEISGTHLFAATDGEGVWRRPLTEMMTSVDRCSNTCRDFQLKQNFPNPFNPETTIDFQLPEESDVQLRIYNMLGKEVRVLENRRNHAGYYSLRWGGLDNSDQPMPSGVYLCRLQAGNFSQWRKMSLLR